MNGIHYKESKRAMTDLSIRIISVAVACVMGLLLAATFYTHHHLQHHQSKAVEDPNVVSVHSVATPEESLIEDLWPDDGSDKRFFLSLSSCAEDCDGQEGNDKVKKVGLLVPPGTMSRSIFLQFCKKILGTTSADSIQLIPTSHLPPNIEEYTHIVRFADIPLLLSIGDALLNVASSQEKITYQDITESCNLLISWHCQLSNLADYQLFPLLTISMEEIDQDQVEAQTRLRDFLGIGDATSGSTDHIIDEDELSKMLKTNIGTIKVLLKKINKQALAETKKGLVSLTKEIIMDAGCPKDDGLYQPSSSSTMAKRVYEFLKEGIPHDDEVLCKKQGLCLREPFSRLNG